jgi:hypothetical protein
MGTIPLPALSARGPNPNEMANAFGQAIRLRQMGLAQQQNAQNDQQRNAIAQQEANQQAQAQQFRAQQYQQAMKDQQLQNQAWQASTQGGKFDSDAFSKHLTDNGFQGDVIGASKDAQAVYAAKQTAEENAGKQGQAYVKGAFELMGQAGKITNRDTANNTFLNGLRTMGDQKDLAYFSAKAQSDPDGLYATLKSQVKPQANTNEASLSLDAQETDSDGQPTANAVKAQKALASIHRESSIRPTPGTVNGKPAWAISGPNGWQSYDASRTPLPNFLPKQSERGSGSQKFSPQNPAPAQMFQALDDEKNAKLQEIQSWYDQQRQKLDDAMAPPQAAATLNNQAAARKQQTEDWYETQNRKLGGQPKHYSYFSPATATPATATPAAQGQQAGKQVTLALAQQYLVRAGGNKQKAREMAKADGYTF